MVYNVPCLLYSLHCTLYNTLCSLYNTLCSLYIVHCKLYTVHCRLNTLLNLNLLSSSQASFILHLLSFYLNSLLHVPFSTPFSTPCSMLYSMLYSMQLPYQKCGGMQKQQNLSNSWTRKVDQKVLEEQYLLTFGTWCLHLIFFLWNMRTNLIYIYIFFFSNFFSEFFKTFFNLIWLWKSEQKTSKSTQA